MLQHIKMEFYPRVNDLGILSSLEMIADRTVKGRSQKVVPTSSAWLVQLIGFVGKNLTGKSHRNHGKIENLVSGESIFPFLSTHWLVVFLEHGWILFFHLNWEWKNHSNWRTHIFQRGRYTTNQRHMIGTRDVNWRFRPTKKNAAQ